MHNIMVATAFNEENTVLNPPLGMTTEQCEPLPVWIGQLGDGTSVVISCWKVTVKELEEIKQTGRVWLTILGVRMPPVSITGESPFKEVT